MSPEKIDNVVSRDVPSHPTHHSSPLLLSSRSPHIAHCILIFVLLAAIYMLTYSGQIELGDEIQYFDAVGNLAVHGTMLQDLSLWQPGSEPSHFSSGNALPLRPLSAEPIMIAAAVPLYQLAERVSNLGLVHTVYLFNIMITPLICVLLYLIVRALDYDVRVAIIGALCLGLLTAFWPYSQTFFREQLMVLFLLFGVLFLEYARSARPLPLGLKIINLGIGLLGLILAWLTKEAAVLAFPGVILLALPEIFWRNRLVMRFSNLALILMLAIPLLVAYTDILSTLSGLLPHLPLLGRFALETAETRQILHIFAFSIGGSFWGTSPILLLAIPGGWQLWQRGERRLVIGALAVVFGYCVGYALFRGDTWHGGTIWPQRFLLPVLPFALLLALPFLQQIFSPSISSDKIAQNLTPQPPLRTERGGVESNDTRVGLGTDNQGERTFLSLSPRFSSLITHHSSLPLLITFLLLALYSLWWQFSGVSYRWEMYATHATVEQSLGLIHWLPGYNELGYLRPIALTRFWGSEYLNFAWIRTDTFWWPLAFGTLAFVCAWLLWRLCLSGLTSDMDKGFATQQPHPPTPSPYTERGGRAKRDGDEVKKLALSLTQIVLIFPLIFFVMTFAALTAIYPKDEAYLASREDLRALVGAIREHAQPGDVILVNDPENRDFFFNYGKVGQVWTVILPYHPGDRGSCDQELQIISDNPADLLGKGVIPLITRLAEIRAKVWLVMSSGPEIPCVIRPLERYLGQHYYRMAETKASPRARLIEYAAVSAPDAYSFRSAEYLADLRFISEDAELLNLTGYTLPRGTTYRPGEILPLSLVWQTDHTPERDYTVAWFLANPETGMIAAQGEDTWPGATFAPATLMTPGLPYWDHRALQLPSDLLPGEYALWVKVYFYDSVQGKITDLAVIDAEKSEISEPSDEVIGILPTRIIVAD